MFCLKTNIIIMYSLCGITFLLTLAAVTGEFPRCGVNKLYVIFMLIAS